jgi:hypothetical protein
MKILAEKGVTAVILAGFISAGFVRFALDVAACPD